MSKVATVWHALSNNYRHSRAGGNLSIIRHNANSNMDPRLRGDDINPGEII